MLAVVGQAWVAHATTLPARQVELLAPNGRAYVFQVQVAQTEATRARGLMGRQHLRPTEGMLFLYPGGAHVQMWMKDTLIPLDMLFFKRDVLVHIEPKVQPHDLTPRGPFEPVTAVLEVPAGTAAALGVRRGWRWGWYWPAVADGAATTPNSPAPAASATLPLESPAATDHQTDHAAHPAVN